MEGLREEVAGIVKQQSISADIQDNRILSGQGHQHNDFKSGFSQEESSYWHEAEVSVLYLQLLLDVIGNLKK